MRLDEQSAVGADEVEGSVVGEAKVVTEGQQPESHPLTVDVQVRIVGAVDPDFRAQPPDRAEQRVTEFQPSLIVKLLVLDDDRDSSTAYRLGNGSALAWGSSSRNSAATPR
jgi:hypothetical protein